MSVEFCAAETASVPSVAFLRIPPFRGAKLRDLVAGTRGEQIDAVGAEALTDLIRLKRVGGAYWGVQPELPPAYVLLQDSAALDCAEELGRGSAMVVWTQDSKPFSPTSDAVVVTGECDPWHMLSGATAFIAEAQDELCIIAAILGVPTYLRDGGGLVPLEQAEPATIVRDLASRTAYTNPFTSEEISFREAVELCGFWRSLVDSNRDLAGGFGFAFWKQGNVAPLLWGGGGAFQFYSSSAQVRVAAPVAVWRAKAPSGELAKLEQFGVPIVEVEDGFLRSHGLGADCVPPLSITVDRLGPYFDPARASELELLLEHGDFDESLMERARLLRSLIVEAGLGKYECGGDAPLDRPAGDRRHILVPGQVEDDRSVMTGGGGLKNLDVLKLVRRHVSDAYILYKPHPDVLAGHRKGRIPEQTCLDFADEIVVDAPISSLIGMVDEVHVNTSLAGFEALMRGKPVTTYGVPFYAGWGLTCDKGPVPARRTAKRTVDELVAATLLLYPRYLDPVTGLPCPAEIVVSRLAEGSGSGPGVLVAMRRLQGKIMRRIRSVLP